MKYKKSKLTLLVCLCVLVSLFFIADASSQELEVVRFYNQPFIARAPIYIAKEEGFFKEEGIDLEFVKLNTPAEALILLMQGALDVSYGPVTPGMFNAVKEGKRIKLTAGTVFYEKGNKSSAFVIRKNGGTLNTDQSLLIRSLAGKKVANPVLGDFFHYLVETLFKNNGVAFKDQDLRIMPFPLIASSIEKGILDAGTLTEPLITPLINKNIISVIAAGDVISGPSTFIVYGPNLLDKKPNLGIRFMRAYLKGCKQYREGKTQRNISIIKKYIGLDEGILAAIDWPVIRPEGILDSEIIKKYQDWALKKKYITEEINVDSMIDFNFIERAREVIK